MQQLIVEHIHFTQIDYNKDDVLVISEAIIDSLVYYEEVSKFVAYQPPQTQTQPQIKVLPANETQPVLKEAVIQQSTELELK